MVILDHSLSTLVIPLVSEGSTPVLLGLPSPEPPQLLGFLQGAACHFLCVRTDASTYVIEHVLAISCITHSHMNLFILFHIHIVGQYVRQLALYLSLHMYIHMSPNVTVPISDTHYARRYARNRSVCLAGPQP